MGGVHLRVGAGGEHYALSVEDVLEVAQLGDVTPVPGAERPFLGVRNLRGEVLPVVDLAALLGVQGETDPDQIVVAQAGALRAGLAVEEVVGVTELAGPRTPTEVPQLQGATLVDGVLVGLVDAGAALSALASRAQA